MQSADQLMRAKIDVSSQVERTARVQQLEGLFAIPPTQSSNSASTGGGSPA